LIITSSKIQPGKPEEKMEGSNQKVIGENPVAGFELDLSRLKV